MATPRKRPPPNGAPPRWWYAPAEIEEIRASLASAGEQGVTDGQFNDLCLQLRVAITTDLITLYEVVATAETDVCKLESDIEILSNALHALQRLGAPATDLAIIANNIYRARDLIGIRSRFISDAGETRKKSNNYRPLRNRICSIVDRAWNNAGGEIGYTAQYEKFFNSVVRPPFCCQEIMNYHGVSWAQTMWRAHVSDVRSNESVDNALQFRGIAQRP